MSGPRTNFAGYTHQQLYAMLQAGDPTTARAAAEQWNSASRGLYDQAENLSDQLTDFSSAWTGGAADQYRTMMTDLVGGIRKVAVTAQGMRDMLEDAADALVKAKAEMPPPVAVPDVSPPTSRWRSTRRCFRRTPRRPRSSPRPSSGSRRSPTSKRSNRPPTPPVPRTRRRSSS